MHFNFAVSIIATVAVVLCLVLLYQRRSADEAFLALKLVGYYLLGSFVVNAQRLPIPIGIGIYLIAFHPKENAVVKRYSAFFGLLVMLLGHLFPF